MKNESKHFWKYVRSKVKSQISVTYLKQDDSSVTESDQEKGEVLYDFLPVFLPVKIRMKC